MRTIVYIDGYNLYFGRLKFSEYKWLDIYQLFSNILKNQSPRTTISKVKYFTASIKTSLSTSGKKSEKSQNDYHRALEATYSDKIEIIKGFHSLDSANLPKYKHPLDSTERVRVWRLEEKQTDVNIALHVYRDVIQKSCDQIVLVSNDSDLEPALKMVRQDVGDSMNIGIVIPVPPKSHRPPSKKLSAHANWTRRYILDDELAQAQLPSSINTKKGRIQKPGYW